jgi:hypothetical protein
VPKQTFLGHIIIAILAGKLLVFFMPCSIFFILHGFTSAAKNPDWLAAINEEIKALHDN